MRILCLVVCMAPFLQAQSPTDSQLLLNEVRQLRQDLAATSIGVQRTQILLFRLQLQESATNRATQRADEARSRLANLQARRKNMADQVQGLEAELARTQDMAQRVRLPTVIASMKKMSENGPEEQEAQTKQYEAETQLRTEQGKRDALEAALDRIDKELQTLVKRQ